MEKLKHTYKPIDTENEIIELPVMSFTGLSKQKYLILPEEYFDVERHILLNGAVLVPMKNDFDQTEN